MLNRILILSRCEMISDEDGTRMRWSLKKQCKISKMLWFPDFPLACLLAKHAPRRKGNCDTVTLHTVSDEDETKFKELSKILKSSLTIWPSQARSLTNHALKRGDFDVVTLYTFSDEDWTKNWDEVWNNLSKISKKSNPSTHNFALLLANHTAKKGKIYVVTPYIISDEDGTRRWDEVLGRTERNFTNGVWEWI